jgi:uncharacterized alpha/beta hydrolase family protein
MEQEHAVIFQINKKLQEVIHICGKEHGKSSGKKMVQHVTAKKKLMLDKVTIVCSDSDIKLHFLGSMLVCTSSISS